MPLYSTFIKSYVSALLQALHATLGETILTAKYEPQCATECVPHYTT